MPPSNSTATPTKGAASSTPGRKGVWTPEEDELLRAQVAKHGQLHWAVVAQGVPGRSGKSCRLRWLNQLEPSLRKVPFTEEEDRHILQMFLQMGPKWAQIAKTLPGRSDNAVKNHFNSSLKKRWQVLLLPSLANAGALAAQHVMSPGDCSMSGVPPQPPMPAPSSHVMMPSSSHITTPPIMQPPAMSPAPPGSPGRAHSNCSSGMRVLVSEHVDGNGQMVKVWARPCLPGETPSSGPPPIPTNPCVGLTVRVHTHPPTTGHDDPHKPPCIVCKHCLGDPNVAAQVTPEPPLAAVVPSLDDSSLYSGCHGGHLDIESQSERNAGGDHKSTPNNLNNNARSSKRARVSDHDAQSNHSCSEQPMGGGSMVHAVGGGGVQQGSAGVLPPGGLLVSLTDVGDPDVFASYQRALEQVGVVGSNGNSNAHHVQSHVWMPIDAIHQQHHAAQPDVLAHPHTTPVQPHTTPVQPHTTPVQPHTTAHAAAHMTAHTAAHTTPVHPHTTPVHPHTTPVHPHTTPVHPEINAASLMGGSLTASDILACHGVEHGLMDFCWEHMGVELGDVVVPDGVSPGGFVDLEDAYL